MTASSYYPNKKINYIVPLTEKLIISGILLGSFIFSYNFIIGSILILFFSCLNIKQINKQALLLPGCILLAIFIIKISSFFTQNIISTASLKSNKTIEYFNIWLLLIFFTLTMSSSISQYKKQITLCLIFSTIPLVILSLFMPYINLQKLNFILTFINWQGINNGFFNNPNIYALYLATIWLLTFNFLSVNKTNLFFKYFIFIFLIITAYLLYQLNCRSALLSLTIATVIQIILLKKNHPIFEKYKKFLLLILISLFIISIFIIFNKTFFNPTLRMYNSHLDINTQARLYMWYYSLIHIPENLWFGHGWGTFVDHFNNAHLLKSKIDTHNHNTYLYLLYSGGIFVFLSYASICVIALKNIQQNKQSLLLYFTPVLVLLFSGLFDHILYFPKVQLLFFILLALLHSINNKDPKIEKILISAS